MENHFHLVGTTPDGNLSKWMHQLKTAYTVFFNRRHQVVGHLFQGRFKSTVIEAEKYLLEVESKSRAAQESRTEEKLVSSWSGAGPGACESALSMRS